MSAGEWARCMGGKLHDQQVPVAPGATPLFGHALRLLRDPLRWLDECRETGPVVRVRLGPRPLYLVSLPALVHEMLVSQADSFDKGGPIFDNGRELIGNGVATSTEEDHRIQRRLMQPAFAQPRIAAYATVMREEGNTLAETWRPNSEVDLLAELDSLTMRVLIRALLPTTGLQEVERFRGYFQVVMADLFPRLALPHPIFRQLPIPSNRRFNRARVESFAAAERIVAAARTQPDSSGMLAALGVDGAGEEAFSDQELRDQVITLLVAGSQTVAGTLAWLFHLLAQHPEVEARLHAELDTVLAGRSAGLEDVQRLPFTRNLLLETIRLYPVAWLLTRISITEVNLGGHRFPAGTGFFFSPYQLHRDAASFPDPERFDPDRWNSPREAITRHGYIPFGAGRRKCIGDTFGMTEATIVLSAVAARWRLRPAPGNRVRAQSRISLTPVGLRMIVEPRTGHG
jgi:cytochrome P450